MPDSQQIVFTAYPRRGNGDIYRIKADGQRADQHDQQRRRQRQRPGLVARWVRLAFVSNRHQGAGVEIYQVWSDDSDSIRALRMTENEVIDSNPTWSPDSQQLAFVSNRGGSFAIYSMQYNGRDQLFLANGEAPAWSPTP